MKSPQERERLTVTKIELSYVGFLIAFFCFFIVLFCTVVVANADVTTSQPEYEEGVAVDWAGGNTCGWALYTSDDGYTSNLFIGQSSIIGGSGSDLYTETGGVFPDTIATYRLMCLQDANCNGDYANCDALNSGIPTPWEVRFDVIEATEPPPDETASSTLPAFTGYMHIESFLVPLFALFVAMLFYFVLLVGRLFRKPERRGRSYQSTR